MGEAIARWNNWRDDDGIGLVLFNQGDSLKITAMPLEGTTSLYYRAYCNGDEGLVSAGMIDVKSYSWYWAGTADRSLAETQLLQSKDKKFLIRETSPWNYYLSYKIQEKVYHFKIHTRDTEQDRTFLFEAGPNGLQEFNTILDLAWFIQKRSFYSTLWWKPSPLDDEMDLLEYRSRKYMKWSSNN